MFGGPTDESTSVRIIHKAIDSGINFIDTADMYNSGRSEQILGTALKDRRDQVVVATKGRQPVGEGPNQAGASRRHLMKQLHESLRRLSTDYIDIYYVHTPDYETEIEETLRALDDMVHSGKVHYIGCSNFRAWRVCEALWTSDRCNLHRFACVQPLYNIVNRDIEVELLPLCHEHRLGVVSYSPLARGILTGKYRSQDQFPAESRAARDDARLKQAELRRDSIEISQKLARYCEGRGATASRFALAWCLANPVLTSIIVGPRTEQQFDDNYGCLEICINEEDETFVNQLVAPGEHSGKGFQDPMYPVTGRPTGA